MNEESGTPWALGLIVAAGFAAFAACLLTGIYTLLSQVSGWLGLAAVLVVAGGLGWTLWELRDRPVWRWIVWGVVIGFLVGVASAVALLATGR